ncbi:MAG: helix-turn-helix domain-containing protein [Chloroflexota bacterium]
MENSRDKRDERSAKIVLSDADFRDQADFRAAWRRFQHFSEEQARLAGITPQQHQVLLAVRGHADYPSVTIGAVAEALQIRHHSASLLIDRCFRRRLLNRNEDPADRRRALISLTDEGHRILEQITHSNRLEMRSLRGALFRESMQQALQAYDSAREGEESTS